MNYSDYLAHHGIKGQKWGVRRYQNPDGSYTSAGMNRYGYDGSRGGGAKSLAGTGHRVAAKIYDINAKTYSKLGNKTLASMNAAARTQSLKKAEAADQKKQNKVDAQNAKIKSKVDVSIAKNSATKRVANDFHSMTNDQFRRKYKTSKNKFAKRYEKTKGDTFTLGRKKQAAAIAFLNAKQGHGLARTAASIAKYDMASKADQKLLDKGHKFTSSIVSQSTANMMRKDFANTYYMPEWARKKYHLEKKD